MSKQKNRYFAKHAKSSAALVSLGIHAVLIVIALSFVAVTVITKDEQHFEAKEVKRPRVKLNKLQAPIKMEKKRKPKPKLRKRLVVKPKLNQKMPDIKMPEVTGVKGGMGSAGDGLGGGGSLGFSMPEINIFGVKGKGEKIFIILDSSNSMMVDEIGGIPAFELIKKELVSMLGNLNPTVLFNIGVYGGGDKLFFDKWVPATPGNIAKVKEMIDPLNAVSENMRDTDYGTKTIGSGAQPLRGDFEIAKIQSVQQWGWVKLALYAAGQRADSVFLLTQGWGAVFNNIGEAAAFSPEKRAKWDAYMKQARQKLEAENKQRKAKGQAPRVFVNAHRMTLHYFPSAESPPIPQRHYFRANEVYEGMGKTYLQSKQEAKLPTGSGVSKKKTAFSFNTILFEKTDGSPIPYDTANGGSVNNFKKMAALSKGDFRSLKGLKSIQDASAEQ